MSWLEGQHKDPLKYWLRYTSSPLLVSQLDGEIVWCNPAFEELLGYTNAEISNQQIKWTDLTQSKEDLQADLMMAKELALGNSQSYKLQKEYRRKAGGLVRVIIHVMRYPPSGNLDYFLVTVLPLDMGYDFAMEKLANLEDQLIKIFSVMSENNTNKLWEWANENKPISAALFVLFLTLLLGDRVVEIVKAIKDVFL